MLSRNINFDPSDARILERAVEYGDKPLIKMLLQRGADIKHSGVLCNAKDVEMANWLISQGADINFISNKNALYSAFFKGRIDVAEFLINKGLGLQEAVKIPLLERGINHTNYQKIVDMFIKMGVNLKDATLLNNAYNYPEMIEWLINKGANVNAIDEHGYNALRNASSAGVKIVKILIKHNIDLGPESAKKALLQAVYYNKKDVIEELIAYGVDIKLPCLLHQACTLDMAEWLIDKGVNINATDLYGKSALYGHVAAGRIEIVKLLLKHDLTLMPDDLDSLLNNSIYGSYSNVIKMLVDFFEVDISKYNHLLHKVRSKEMAKYLIENGADINGIDEHGKNPLYYALQNQHSYPQVAMFLFSRGARFNQEDKVPLLELMSQHTSLDLIELLIKDNVDVKHSNALHYATNVNIAKLLVDNGAEPHKELHNHTVLYSAACTYRVDVVQFLLQLGAKFNESEKAPLLVNAVAANHKVLAEILINSIGNIKELCTLHKATNVEMAEWLISKGADINLKDSSNKSPLYYAAKCNYSGLSINLKIELVKFFLNKNLKFAEENKLELIEFSVGYNGCSDIAQLLLPGVDMQKVCLLHKARTLDMAKWLISKGVKINLADKDGKDALYHSVFFNNAPEITKLLLNEGLRFQEEDKKLLLEQIGGNNRELTSILIEQGADIKKACVLHNVNNLKVAKWLIEQGADVHLKDLNNKTALYQAAANNRLLIVKLLLDDEVEFVIEELPELLSKAITSNYKEIAQILVENGADLKQAGLLSKASNVDMALFLINNGADVNEIDDDGNTAFNSVIQQKKYQLAEFLLKQMQGDILLEKNIDGKTALHYANEQKNESIISELLFKMNLSSSHNDLDQLNVHDILALGNGSNIDSVDIC